MEPNPLPFRSLKRGTARRPCICCGDLFPSRDPSHRVCQACEPRHTRLRFLTRFDPRLTYPDRGRHVESCPAGG